MRAYTLRNALFILTLSLSAFSAEPAAQQLFNEAAARNNDNKLEQATVKLEKCVKLKPEFPPCFRLLGAVHAAIATRDQSVPEMEKARTYYERFIDLEPPTPEPQNPSGSPSPMGDWGGLPLPAR